MTVALAACAALGSPSVYLCHRHLVSQGGESRPLLRTGAESG